MYYFSLCMYRSLDIKYRSLVFFLEVYYERESCKGRFFSLCVHYRSLVLLCFYLDILTKLTMKRESCEGFSCFCKHWSLSLLGVAHIICLKSFTTFPFQSKLQEKHQTSIHTEIQSAIKPFITLSAPRRRTQKTSDF